MLTYDDEPTIRWAIERRMDKEPGVKCSYVHVEPCLEAMPPFLAVGVTVELGLGMDVTSVFHVPSQFEHGHLMNELDEIAEKVKEARAHFFRNGMDFSGKRVELKGTGHRGHWKRYG